METGLDGSEDRRFLYPSSDLESLELGHWGPPAGQGAALPH